jgi:uncharacterized damage-inducible protein DinB
MYHTIAEFVADWAQESAGTAKLMAALTDASLAQPVTEGDRSLGWTAWHIVGAMVHFARRVGLELKIATADVPVPEHAAQIAEAYQQAARELAELVREKWTDATLKIEEEVFPGRCWARGVTLQVLLRHEIHHRGQMTVLMRQAGLRVPGVYGPAREEWAAMGMKEPAVS